MATVLSKSSLFIYGHKNDIIIPLLHLKKKQKTDRLLKASQCSYSYSHSLQQEQTSEDSAGFLLLLPVVAWMTFTAEQSKTSCNFTSGGAFLKQHRFHHWEEMNHLTYLEKVSASK